MGVLNFIGRHVRGDQEQAQQAPQAQGQAVDPARAGGYQRPSLSTNDGRDGDWLDLFTAVRAMRGAPLERARSRQLVAAGEHEQQGWDTERQRQVTEGALGAYSNMVSTINSSLPADATPEQRQELYGAAFDRIFPALQSAGYGDTSNVQALRQQFIANPDDAPNILSAISGAQGGSRPSLQAAIGPDGRAVFLDPVTRRPVAQGYAPATTVLGQGRLEQGDRRLALSGDQLEQRQLEHTPAQIYSEANARSEGRDDAERSNALPQADAATEEVLRRVDTILTTDPSRIGDVLGLPTLASAMRGGFGSFGALPGSGPADVQAEISGLGNSMRSLAYQLVLKGGGSITEAESAFSASAFANLDRSQSPRQFISNLQAARQFIVTLHGGAHDAAAPSSRNAPARPTARPAAPAAAPTTPSISDDELLQRYLQ